MKVGFCGFRARFLGFQVGFQAIFKGFHGFHLTDSDFKDFWDFTSEFKVFKPDCRDFRSDYIQDFFRPDSRTFVHRISEVVGP